MTVFISPAFINLLKASRSSARFFLVRNAARKPVKVLQEDEPDRKYRVTSGNYNPYIDPNRKRHETKESDILLPSGFPRFEKKGDDDLTLSQFAMNTSCSKKRKKSGLFMVEGKRLITEALQARVTPKAVFFSHLEDVISLPFQSHTFIFQKVTYKRIKRWSQCVTPPGVVAFFKTPNIEKKIHNNSLPITVICNNVRDPGNLGSILRVAAGVGCKEVLLTIGCVDVWGSKVLRSGAGSHFHLVVKSNLSWEDISSRLLPESRLYLADNSSDLKETLENNLYPENFEVKNLPIVQYYDETFTNSDELFLVVGGETMGISENVKTLSKSQKIVRLHVPMENGVESLNVGTAVAVLLYEMKRQLENCSLSLKVQTEAL